MKPRKSHKIYLPIEIVEQVLLRLPINSILRCSSTCKTWYNLITSPHFISAQLHYTKSLPSSTHLLIQHCSKVWPWKRNIVLYSDDEPGFTRTFEEYEKFSIGESESFSCFLGCCNGLICLVKYKGFRFSFETKTQEVVLWNPMIRRSLYVPKSHADCSILEDQRSLQTFGFVFDDIGNDYKILRIRRSSNILFMVEVFRLSTGLWEDISCKAPFVDICLRSHQVNLKGIAHWIGEDDSGKRKIITFDANKEVFGSIELPTNVVNYDDIYIPKWGDKFVFVFKESLFLIRSIIARVVGDKSEFRFDIWRMGEYNVVESWNQVRTWAFDTAVRPVGFRKNGEIHWVNNFGKLISTHLDDPSINYFDICINDFYESYIDYVGSLKLLDKSLSSGADDKKVEILQE